jgi:hypothetical protein
MMVAWYRKAQQEWMMETWLTEVQQQWLMVK